MCEFVGIHGLCLVVYVSMVCRYYTPSGRCIQAVRYTGGRDTSSPSSSAPPSSPSSSTITTTTAKERQVFHTLVSDREVFDGGGIDFDVSAPPLRVSSAEATLYTQVK